jgi:hypothetical protein
MDWCRCGKGWKTSEAIQRQGLGAGFQLSGHTPGMALGSVVKWAVGPYCGSGDASLIHDELIPTGIETGAQFIVPAGIHPSKHRVPTPQPQTSWDWSKFASTCFICSVRRRWSQVP